MNGFKSAILLLGSLLCSASAAQQPDPRLVPALGAMRMGDYAQAIDVLKPLVAKQEPEAYALMGLIMESMPEEQRDLAAARDWYLKGAQAGSAAAKNGLGVLYLTGKGVPKNAAEAAKWFRESAEQGNAEAQYNVGMRYLDGDGVPQDVVEAVRWFRRSADQGFSWGELFLGAALQKGIGIQRDLDAAHMWIERAAKAGNKTAMRELARIYRLGLGVPADDRRADALENLAK